MRSLMRVGVAVLLGSVLVGIVAMLEVSGLVSDPESAFAHMIYGLALWTYAALLVDRAMR